MKAVTSFAIEKIDLFVFRAPADPPVQTSFGIMRDRPAVLLRVTDPDGAHGWGEIWCNFPVVGAEHRARMASTYLPTLVCGKTWTSPQECFKAVSEQLAVLAIQCGEPGPIQQMVAGFDIAVWDLIARKASLPLWKLLNHELTVAPRIALYASGINPTHPERLAEAKLEEGYRAFKLKVGFGRGRDDANLRAVREVIGAESTLMVDANQAWDLHESIEAGRRMAVHDLAWLEEPVRADASLDTWSQLAAAQPVSLAGGENVAGHASFDHFIATPGIAIVQPDIGKWGGFSGCIEVGRATVGQGKRFCPHWLGGGIGLAASFHLKAAVGGPGFVEVDANPNPLRECLATPAFVIDDGAVVLGDSPGIGVLPDLDECGVYLVAIGSP
ncbi:mandelate racemase/muconate lactonizing enzyme family protein [soil metagenome]